MVIFAYRYIRKYIEYLIYIIFKILRIWLMIYKLKILLQLQQPNSFIPTGSFICDYERDDTL